MTTRNNTMNRIGVAATLTMLAGAAVAADHKEAPLIRQDLPADINDVYAFVNPTDSSRLVLAMTVNPFTDRAENTNFRFSSDVRYSFFIDRDNDGDPEARITVTFSEVQADGGQTFEVTLPTGDRFTGDVTPPTIEPEPNDPIINSGPANTMAYAGNRDDPFFFDVVGFSRFLAGTGGFSGSDGFAGFNVSTLVIELPAALVSGGGDQIQVWGETERRQVTLRRASRGQLEANVGPWQQIERMGNPAVNTALIPFDLKDRYNIGDPSDDADEFADDIVATLMALGTNQENIDILASVAVPDTLKIDLTQDIAYPNGRAPEDDVIDTLLFFIFNQTETPDGVDENDREFLDEFPYFAPPFQPA